MAHQTTPRGEAVLDTIYPVLDKGFVRLVDYMGSDARIVQSARVSYGKGTKTVREDAGLIDYLLRNEHTSPFEQVVFTFHIKMPLFVARQWLRHRTARLNEISGRYSVMKDDFYLPSEGDIAFQSSDNKQGRSSENVPEELKAKVLGILKKGQSAAYEDYECLLDGDIARELARINLPLSLYTEMYWQIDLHNLFHFLKLRLDSHAQKEIRDYAKVLEELGSAVCPLAFRSFDNHIRKGLRLSGEERAALIKRLNGESDGLDEKKRIRLQNKLQNN